MRTADSPKVRLNFSKYSGCGNDFIIIDNRDIQCMITPEQVIRLCSRKNGIGADGIILFETSKICDFKMRILNADGSEAEMCGNGIRCLVDFAIKQGFQGLSCTIESLRRTHKATWTPNIVTVSMGSPTDIVWDIELPLSSHPLPMSYLDTGVPHAVIFCEDIEEAELDHIGPQVRLHPHFNPRGTNVNFVEVQNDNIAVRTYERGVEAETEACGTGATAAAIAAAIKHQLKPPISVKLRSGEMLTIDFTIHGDTISNVTMSGPCLHIFDGTIAL